MGAREPATPPGLIRPVTTTGQFSIEQVVVVKGGVNQSQIPTSNGSGGGQPEAIIRPSPPPPPPKPGE